MKKVKLCPSANIVSAETLKQKFNRLASSIGDNGLTSSFSYVIIAGTYGIKAGINPQNKQTVDYPTVKAVKIGQKSNKVCGIAELSINSLKRTVNIEENFIDVVTELEEIGKKLGVEVHCQKEEIFTKMHRI